MGIHFFYFGFPTISQGILAPQKWFTYQNDQNFPRKTGLLFLEQSVEKVILKINQETKKNYLHWPNYIALQWFTCFERRPWRL